MRKIIAFLLVSAAITFGQIIPYDYNLNNDRLNKSLDKTPVSNTAERILINGETVWIGTSKGLSKTINKGNNWQNYFGTKEFEKEHISALGYGDGIIWSATWHYEIIAGSAIPVGTGFKYSEDDGATWKSVPQPVDQQGDSSIVYGINTLRALPVTVPQQNFCYDIATTSNTVWSVNFAGGLRKSTNKGASWQRVVLPPDNLNSIKPTDTLKFSLQPSPGKFGPESYLNHRAFSIYADDDNTIWVGTAGGINKSTDGGVSWQKFNHTNQSKPISGNYILAIEKNEYDNSIWAATWKAEGQTEDWGVSRTTDGGLTWDTFLLGERALDFAFKYHGTKGNYTGADIIVATRNGLFRSTNNGSTWIALNSVIDINSNVKLETNTYLAAETSKLNDSSTDFWIGTDNGLVYTNEKNSSWDGNWRIFLASGSSADNTESFAFPNPFSPNKEKIKIKFSLMEHSDVTIRILDFGMNLIKTVIQNASRSANEEQIEIWDGRDEFGNLVPNGVYFYRIDKNSDEPIFGKIMVLM